MFLGHLTSLREAIFRSLSNDRFHTKISVNVLRSRFGRDFLWYHILSGKIITFSLPVMYIYILKAELFIDACKDIFFFGQVEMAGEIFFSSIWVNDILSDVND
jgi:hypothetical protein